MKKLQKGQFFGQTNTTIHMDGITMTDTVYTHDKVDWHYHEHAYFTFILQGNVLEGNKKETYNCGAGTLLFHNWQEPHYNIKPPGFTRGFHIEIEKNWFDGLSFDVGKLQGSINLDNPDAKLLMYRIFRETKLEGQPELAVQGLLLETLAHMFGRENQVYKNPAWVAQIKEILHERPGEKLTLGQLSEALAIHPVHLSRDFPKYFNCSFGEYIRKIRVEKALALIAQNNASLTEIAIQCGFADQSHFIRCFKEINGINPSAHKKLYF